VVSNIIIILRYIKCEYHTSLTRVIVENGSTKLTKLDDSSRSNRVDYDKFNNTNCGSLRTLEDVTTKSPKHEYDWLMNVYY
jgi:hypothetical protein